MKLRLILIMAISLMARTLYAAAFDPKNSIDINLIVRYRNLQETRYDNLRELKTIVTIDQRVDDAEFMQIIYEKAGELMRKVMENWLIDIRTPQVMADLYRADINKISGKEYLELTTLDGDVIETKEDCLRYVTKDIRNWMVLDIAVQPGKQLRDAKRLMNGLVYREIRLVHWAKF